MNLKKIIIYQNEALLGILSEIKDELNLDLFKADKKNILEIRKEFKNDFLLIASEEIKNIKNLLILDKLPIKIEKLIEQINLKFLKERFIEQSDVSIGDYKININSREISKNNKSIYLTEREILGDW